MLSNALRTIWFQPRATIRRLLDETTLSTALILIMLGSVIGAFFNFAMPDEDMQNFIASGWIWFVILIVTPIFSLVGAAISAGLYMLFARMMKGTGSYRDTLRTIGFAALPSIIPGAILAIVISIVMGSQLFQNPEFNTPTQDLVLGFSSLIMVISYIWSFVVLVQGMRVVHNLSGWRAFFTVVLPSIIVTVIIVFFILLLLIPLFFIMAS